MAETLDKTRKDLSVLLCTWNNCKRLAITLDAIAQCEIPQGLDWELVVVNNNCTDDTDAVVEAFRERLPINYVHEPRQGLSNARNAGIAAASGEWVLFTDDDVRPYPQWIKTYLKASVSKPNGYYFGGPVESEFEDDVLPKELRAYAPPSVKGLNRGDVEHSPTTNGRFLSANWMSPRWAIDKVGGFNPLLGLGANDKQIRVGEETDLMIRLESLGLEPWYLPEAALRHFVPRSKIDINHISSRFAASIRGSVGSRKGLLRRAFAVLKKVYIRDFINIIMNRKGVDSHMSRVKVRALFDGLIN